VIFSVDSEFETGARRISNDEVADGANANADIMMAFEAGFKPEVHDLILKRNAAQALKLDAAA
jgi:hypothetical protein